MTDLFSKTVRIPSFYEILRSRRSIRRYKDLPVESEKVALLLKAALLSPSSRAIRPWEFILVDDRDLLAALSQVKPHGAGFLAGAPLGIVVAADASRSDVWVEDAAIASVILLLMAEELGLGACWSQIRERVHQDGASASDKVRELLGIPDSHEVESIIAVGYPDEHKPGYGDADLLVEKLHANRFGTPHGV